MIHNSEQELAFRRSAERSRRSHDAIDRLCLKGDVEAQPLRPHRYSRSTRSRMQPAPPILASEERPSTRQLSPQELAERAAVILALKVTSGKKPSSR